MLTMYDSVNVTEIPLNAEAVAGYVNGRWPTYWTLVAKFPRGTRKLSIAVNTSRDADCLDIESGDATPDEAPWWVKRQLARGKRPVVYTSVSQATTLIAVLAKHGVKRDQYRLWTAHYGHGEHLCDFRCGFGFLWKADATQWTDKALGRNLDQSLCADHFFAPAPPTKRQLRARILAGRRKGVTWSRIKATAAWRRFRALGGR